MQSITIHKAAEGDAKAIAEMAKALAAFEGQDSLADEVAMRAMLKSDREPKFDCIMAKQGEEPIGFALYYTGYDLSSASVGFHLADLYVEESYRGQGVGTQLLAAIAKQAEAEGKQWISLTALKENALAAEFYAVKGFARIPVDFFAIGARGIVALASQ